MARSAQIGLALTLLVVGVAAVQLAPEEENVCGRGFKEFEHVDEKHPSACLVYCVPKGRCEAKQAVTTVLKSDGPGTCHGQGFTERAALGNLTNPIMEKLQRFTGPCKGMKVLKFKKPQPARPKPAPPRKPAMPAIRKGPADRLCGDGRTPFKAIKERGAKCVVYCVPDGACLGMAQAGKLGHLGITGAGLCAGDGYTLRFEPSDGVKYWVSHLWGSCKGMTLYKFQQPPAPEEGGPAMTRAVAQATDPADGRSCGPDLYPFRAVAKHFGGRTVCSAYCVPDGPCHGMVIQGNLKSLGITSEGGCGKQDFPEPAPINSMTLYMVKSAGGGACREMTVHRFQTPAPALPATPTLDPLAGRSCGPDQHPFRGIVTFFGGEEMCSAYCVPDGPCHGMAQTGLLKSVGITSEGGCGKQDFPEPVPINNMTLYMVKSAGGDACKGMTVHRFQRQTAAVEPAAPEEGVGQ